MKYRKPFHSASIFVTLVCMNAVRFAAAQGGVSSTASATTTIIQGMSVTNTSSLRFGAMIPGALGGTSTVAPNGSRSATGTITLLTSSSFPSSAASFNLLGAPNLAYTITLPTSVILTRQGGSDTILLAAFTSSPAASGSLSSTGSGTLSVGGTITITGSQAAGLYSGSFTVTLAYQ